MDKYTNITKRIELLCDLITEDPYYGKDNSTQVKDGIIMELHKASNAPEVFLSRDKHLAYTYNMMEDDMILNHIENYREVYDDTENIRILHVIHYYHEMLADRIANTKEAYVRLKDIIDFVYTHC